MVAAPNLMTGVRFNQADLERFKRKLRTYANDLRKEFGGLSHELAFMARAYARSIAPRDRGYAIRSIQYKTSGKDQAEIRILKSILNENPSNPTNFNYVRWMHEHKGVMGNNVRIRTGDPQFMWTTRDYIQRELRGKIKTFLGRH